MKVGDLVRFDNVFVGIVIEIGIPMFYGSKYYIDDTPLIKVRWCHDNDASWEKPCDLVVISESR